MSQPRAKTRHPAAKNKAAANQASAQLLTLLTAVVLLTAAAILIVFFVLRDSDSSSDEPQEMAANFQLPTVNGSAIQLTDFRGQYVLLNFWATWCPPCKAELPDLVAYHEAHHDEGFTLIAINAGEDASVVNQFMARYGDSFPVALDLNQAVFVRYAGNALPTSVLIGPDGELIAIWEKMISRDFMEREITPRLSG